MLTKWRLVMGFAAAFVSSFGHFQPYSATSASKADSEKLVANQVRLKSVREREGGREGGRGSKRGGKRV